MIHYVTQTAIENNAYARANAEMPCRGVYVKRNKPDYCDVHMLPWGHEGHEGILHG